MALRWRLLIAFAILQLADVLTTNAVLANPGTFEANPIMAASQAHLGAAWWFPKLVLLGLMALYIARYSRRWPLVLVMLYYGAVVSGNLLVLGVM